MARGLTEGRMLLVDVREPNETAVESYPDAVIVPLSAFDPAAIPDPQGKQVVFACRSGRRSVTASLAAQDRGYPYKSHLAGGIIAWKAAGPSDPHRLISVNPMRQFCISLMLPRRQPVARFRRARGRQRTCGLCSRSPAISCCCARQCAGLDAEALTASISRIAPSQRNLDEAGACAGPPHRR